MLLPSTTASAHKVLCAEVALPLPTPSLTYMLPSSHAFSIWEGRRVWVLVGKNRQLGVIWRTSWQHPTPSMRPVLDVLDEGILFPPLWREQIDQWCHYFLVSRGQLLRQVIKATALWPTDQRSEALYMPPKRWAIQKKKEKAGDQWTPSMQKAWQKYQEGVAYFSNQEEWVPLSWLVAQGVSRSSCQRLVDEGYMHKEQKRLWPASLPLSISSPEKQEGEIAKYALKDKPLLLTGAYTLRVQSDLARLIRSTLAQGKQVLVLHPAYGSPSPWIIKLMEELGHRLSYCCQSSSAIQKRKVWHGVLSGQISGAVGDQTALYLPFQALGLVIVEKEELFHQAGKTPRLFHTKHAALFLAQQHGAKTILQAFYPSLRSFWHADRGKYRYLHIPWTNEAEKMDLQVLRPRFSAQRKQVHPPLSSTLLKALIAHLQHTYPVLVLHHRKGYAAYHVCAHCGWLARCPMCHMSLSVETDRFICYRCDYMHPMISKCHHCKGQAIWQRGVGIQQLQELFQGYLSSQEVSYFDRQTSPEQTSSLKAAFKAGELPILLTSPYCLNQLDFPEGPLLVMIPYLDDWLKHPTFDAEWHCSQYILALKRASFKGKVVVQTHGHAGTYIGKLRVLWEEPNRYREVYRQWLQELQPFDLPPWGKIIRLWLLHPQQIRLERAVHVLKDLFSQDEKKEWRVIGPPPAYGKQPNKRMATQIYLQISLQKALKALSQLPQQVKQWLHQHQLQGIEVIYEVDWG